MLHDVTDELLNYLKSWHRTSCCNKAQAGVQVSLSFDDFMSLIDKRQRKSLQKAIDEGRLRSQQHRTSEYALVLSWKSYAARSTNVFSVETACVCSRIKSAQINKPQAGDKLRPAHKAKIGKSLTAKPKSPEHRKAISDGSRGVAKRKWSPERRAARSALRQVQEAAKRATAGGAKHDD